MHQCLPSQAAHGVGLSIGLKLQGRVWPRSHVKPLAEHRAHHLPRGRWHLSQRDPRRRLPGNVGATSPACTKGSASQGEAKDVLALSVSRFGLAGGVLGWRKKPRLTQRVQGSLGAFRNVARLRRAGVVGLTNTPAQMRMRRVVDATGLSARNRSTVRPTRVVPATPPTTARTPPVASRAIGGTVCERGELRAALPPPLVRPGKARRLGDVAEMGGRARDCEKGVVWRAVHSSSRLAESWHNRSSGEVPACVARSCSHSFEPWRRQLVGVYWRLLASAVSRPCGDWRGGLRGPGAAASSTRLVGTPALCPALGGPHASCSGKLVSSMRGASTNNVHARKACCSGSRPRVS